MSVPLLGLDDVTQAADLLQGVATTTPIQRMRSLSERVGGPVVLKCENLQRTGSFKIRGAYVRIARLRDDERSAGVVAASAGNHAQGVALAASLLGTRATIFMPAIAPLPKVAATKAYGAEVRQVGDSVADALEVALDHAERTGAAFIHPYDHADVVAGQGTVGLEIAQQFPDVRTVVVPTGGGGLLAGVAVAVCAQVPDVRVVGVQAKGAAGWPASLQRGEPVSVPTSTVADGIAIARPGDIPFAHVQRLVHEVRSIDDDALARAMVHCVERAKLVVEPAGAAGIAAVMEDPSAFDPPVVVVASGGNVDPLVLAKMIRHGLIAAGRFVSLRVRIPDRPGELARMLTVLGDTGANVLDVEHFRTGRGLHLDEVEVGVQAETRGPDHGDEVRTALVDAGYAVAPG